MKKQIPIIYRNAQRLLRLINQLIDMRKIDQGQLSLNLEKDDLVAFIKQLFDSFKLKAEKGRMDYRFVSNLESLVTYFDKDVIDKIMYNLLSNAFKFTSENGTISLHRRHHGEADTGIAGGGLDEGIAGLQQSQGLRLFDHVERGTVLHRTGRIEALHLDPEFRVRHSRRLVETNDRGVADGLQDVLVLHGVSGVLL